jgi:hypothetical protein
MKSLWEWATTAQQEQAHKTAVCLMEYWLGQSSKQEIARRLDLPPLRVWQLSKQAISGMVVGLLTQPKVRGQSSTPPVDPLKDPKMLCLKITSLEHQVATQARLIQWLRELPGTGTRTQEQAEISQEIAEPPRASKGPCAPKNAKPARKAKLRVPSQT